jgi:hypothetical protein
MSREPWVAKGTVVFWILVLVGVATISGPAGPVGPERTRRMLETAVMALQVVGALALVWSKLEPASGLAAWTLVGAQIGLGTIGIVCARLGSDFALFAGATLVVLLLGTIFGVEVAPAREPDGRHRATPANG